MRIIAIRHGQTDYNKSNRIMGQEIEEPLNETGIEQARSLIPQLKEHDFEMIYASPLLRTKQTAEIINKELGLDIEYRDELKERGVGSLAGKTYEEVTEIIKPAHYDKNYDFREYGGEYFKDVHERVHKFLHNLEEKYGAHDGTGKEILVVTHAGIIQVLYDIFENRERQDVRNVCVHKFRS